MDKDNKKNIDPIEMYLKEISKSPIFSIEKEKELFKKISESDDSAHQKIAFAYLKIVVKVAEYYLPQAKKLTLLDLIQEGNLGLFKALKIYDFNSGYKFLTLATLSIRRSILRALVGQGRIIRIPVDMIVMTSKYLKAKKVLSGKLNREPSAEEIALETGYNIDQINNVIKNYYRKKDYPHNYASESIENPLFRNIKGELVAWENLTKEDRQEIKKKELKKTVYEIKMEVQKNMPEIIELICKTNNISKLEAQNEVKKIFNEE